MVRQMKVDLGTKREVALILLIAAISGAVFGILGGGYSYVGRSAHRENFTIPAGSSVTAQSLWEGTRDTRYSFPPPEYIFEWVEFEVTISNASGVLQVNFTRDSGVLRTEYVYGSEKIMLSGYGEYRLSPSNFDVVLKAHGDDVTIRYLVINISRGVRYQNPVLNAVALSASIGIFIVLPRYLKRRKHPE